MAQVWAPSYSRRRPRDVTIQEVYLLCESPKIQTHMFLDTMWTIWFSIYCHLDNGPYAPDVISVGRPHLEVNKRPFFGQMSTNLCALMVSSQFYL